MSVTERNILALEQSVKNLTERVFSQQTRIDGLVATVGTLIERMTALETALMQMRIAAIGRGPTNV